MAKKQAPRRRHHRRRRGSLGPLLRVLSVLLAAGAIVAAITLFFKVGEIRVSGSGRYSAQEIVEVSQVQEGDNLVLLDKYHIAQRIYTQLPYVSEVSFERRFPDVLEIRVRETGPAFSIRGAETWWLVSLDGKLLEPVAEDIGGQYLQILGVEAQEPVVSKTLTLPEGSRMPAEEIQSFMELLAQRGMLEKTTSLDLTDPTVLTLGYDGRFRVELFYDADFEFKLDCLAATVERLQPNETGVIRMTMKDDSEVRFIPKAQ